MVVEQGKVGKGVVLDDAVGEQATELSAHRPGDLAAGRTPGRAATKQLVAVEHATLLDAAVSSSEEADETGIVVVGRSESGEAYVLADLSGHYAPIAWARIVAAAYRRHLANLVVAETNQGGEMVRDMLRGVDPSLPVKMVHAKRGKYQRAEPAGALYEQGRVHHVGCHALLEDQMCTFTSDIDRRQGSPDRVDALVWGLTHLLVKQREVGVARSYSYVTGGRLLP